MTKNNEPSKGEVVENLELSLDELKEKAKLADDYLEHLQRLKAEFDNYRKRINQKNQELILNIKANIILEILPIYENLEKAIDNAQRQSNLEALISGLNLVLKQFKEFLNKEGVEKIPTIGEKFNPEIHEAVAITHKKDYEDEVIVNEISPGYLINGKLMKAAKVIVNKIDETKDN